MLHFGDGIGESHQFRHLRLRCLGVNPGPIGDVAGRLAFSEFGAHFHLRASDVYTFLAASRYSSLQ